VPTTPGPSTSSAPRVPVKVTNKMLERQQYEKELKEQDEAETEEEELAVFGEDDTDMNVDSVVNKEKGKGKEVPSQTIPPPNNRRTRPAIDPFAGMDLFRHGHTYTY
jgi:exosome complex protein LRP1